MKVIYVIYSKDKSLYVLLVLYLLMLVTINLWGTGAASYNGTTNDFEAKNNFIPFATILTYLMNMDHYNFSTWFNNLLNNILAFIPLGFLIPMLFPQLTGKRKILLISFFTSLTIDSLQLTTDLGVFDVDDILLNMAGGLLGYSLYFYLKNINFMNLFK